jgi:hypothetical protein
MIMNEITIIIFKRGDEIPSKPNGGIGMKEFGTSITQYYPFNGASLFPIGVLLPEKRANFVFQKFFEIPFRNG